MSDEPMTRELLNEMPVEDVMKRWPATAEVFNAHALACVGCALAPFCTVGDATATYELPSQQLADKLLAVIAAASQT
ncbi:MAG: hypothetical protein IPH95_16765 [Candidatus Promineofilum sp.]|nr:hypothetical protein [Promineifilum sp.]